MEDAALFEQLVLENFSKRCTFVCPEGDSFQLVQMAQQNAKEEAERVTTPRSAQRVRSGSCSSFWSFRAADGWSV